MCCWKKTDIGWLNTSPIHIQDSPFILNASRNHHLTGDDITYLDIFGEPLTMGVFDMNGGNGIIDYS